MTNLHSFLIPTCGKPRQSGWKNRQICISLISKITSKVKLFLRLYCPILHCFKLIILIKESFYNSSKLCSLVFLLRAANGLFHIQKLSACLLQEESSSKLPDINQSMATSELSTSCSKCGKLKRYSRCSFFIPSLLSRFHVYSQLFSFSITLRKNKRSIHLFH